MKALVTVGVVLLAAILAVVVWFVVDSKQTAAANDLAAKRAASHAEAEIVRARSDETYENNRRMDALRARRSDGGY